MKLGILAAGNSIHTVRWLNSLAKRGYDIHLLTMHSPANQLDATINVYPLRFPVPFGYFLNRAEARNIIKAIQPDLLHAHYASGYGTLGRLCRFQPFVLSVWGSDIYTFPNQSRINKWIITENLRSAKWVCSTSKHMLEQTLQLCPQLMNISVTPFGVNIVDFQPDSNLKDPLTITIGTVKTLDAIYGIDLLLHAFARVRQKLQATSSELAKKLRLLVVGEGPHAEYLNTLATQINIDSLATFIGPVTHSEVPNYLNKLDIYVAASRSESFGVAVIEASACEVPVVVSDVGGLPEVVKDGETGFVVQQEDVADLTEKLLQLIQNVSLRKQFGKAGRKHVVAKYNWIENVTIMENVYKSVVDANKKCLM